ncbi:hypothetical protein O181_058629 [Austropuccinia psidii MF-1]|uniref:SRP54-type proteins GTP-binding domain-containing protein n=1 Tax=Austropuccinia psidii MF-1 TaxID=1389203 RepID=A0A9Q3ECT9_9BASI|nr:hypothetical protein [Austropuccinia psidii MF-1]
MLDHVHIFHRGGLVLWSKSFVPTPSPIRSMIGLGLIEERSDGLANEHHLQEIQVGSCSLQWNLSNEFGLVFVVAYQSILQLTYISDLLESIKSLFISLYTPILDTYLKSWIVPENSLQGGFKALFTGWDHSFNQLLKDVERMAGRRRGGGLQKAIELEKAASKKQISNQSTSEIQTQDTALTTATDAEIIAKNIAALKARKKKKPSLNGSLANSRAGSRSGTDSDSVPPIKPSIGKKEARKWTDGKLTAKDIAEYDFSENVNDQTSSGQVSALIDLASVGSRNQKGLYEVADYDKGTENLQNQQLDKSLFSKMISLVPFFNQNSGPIVLKTSDVRPIIDQIQLQLMKKNVAQDIAVKICERIEIDLLGKKLTPKSDSLKKLIDESLKLSLTKILTPRSNVDIMMEIQHKQHQQRTYLTQANGPMAPYVMTFVGVNGVGKSTNLSKVAFWLLQNKLRVLVAACDTFRSGAVEQLRVHVGNLSKLDGVMDERYTNVKTNTRENKMKIELYEKGYGKDAAGIAKDAIQYAKNNAFDVVLVDTAGRMQDNEPLMRALGKLVSVNQPDKIIFVGEALVGNEAVHQLGKFDKSLKDFSGANQQVSRGIDGIIVTKFDTIDDKVGAVLSMTYVIGQPILFVGTGQTYTDLKTLRVNHIVEALMRN